MTRKMIKWTGVVIVAAACTSCKLPQGLGRSTEKKAFPASYSGSRDTLNSATRKWKEFFKDPDLVALIDTALKNNQELNITLQEVNISKNEVRAKKGQYFPAIEAGTGAGIEKPARYTTQGGISDLLHEKGFPEPLPDFKTGIEMSWEADIWKRLRNSKKAAMYRYLSSVDGKNFMVTNLIAEIANSYYELMALDNQVEILKKTIEIQQSALEIVKLEKDAAKVTELAVQKFEAEVLKNQSRQYYIMQQIAETENHINFLAGKFPGPVKRNSQNFNDISPDTVYAGIPSQLLQNRSDIRQAEKQLIAAKLDVKVARAEFYPSLVIRAGAGYQAFNTAYLIQSPQSLVYSLAGHLAAPLINRSAIKANYYSATSKQIQAVYNFERTLLRAHIEVANQISNISNLKMSYDLKLKQVQALTKSIDISTMLFRSARADYMEVLLTQRDALESRFELIETRKNQLNAMVDLYRAIGGGWK